MQKKILWAGWWSLMVSVLVFTSCATGPKIHTRKDWYTLLPEKATAYLVIHFSPVTRDLIKNISSGIMSSLPVSSTSGSDSTIKNLQMQKLMGPLLERTDEVALAVEKQGSRATEIANSSSSTLSPEVPMDPLMIYGLLEGRFPKYFIESSLRKNKDWHQVKGLYSYWESPAFKVQIFFIDSSTILFSNGGLITLLQRFQNFPSSTEGNKILLRKLNEREAAQEAEPGVSITAGNPGQVAEYTGKKTEERSMKNELLFYVPALNGQELPPDLSRNTNVNMPLKQILISADIAGKDYNFRASLEFLEEPNLRDTSNLLRLSLLYLLRKGNVAGLTSRLKPLAITQESSYIFVEGLKLNENDLTKIFINLIARRSTGEE